MSENIRIRSRENLLLGEYQSFKVGLEQIRQEPDVSSSSKSKDASRALPINPVFVYSAMLILAVSRKIKNRNSSY